MFIKAHFKASISHNRKYNFKLNILILLLISVFLGQANAQSPVIIAANKAVETEEAQNDPAVALFRKRLAAPFPYKAANFKVNQIIADFAKRTGNPVRIHGDLSGRVDIENIEGSVEDFLDSLSSVSQIAWWYDGAAFHFEPNKNTKSEIIETRGYSVLRLKRTIHDLGIVNRPFPIRQSADGTLLYIAGPEKYVETAAELARRLVNLNIRRRNGEVADILPRIYVGSPSIQSRNG